MCNVRNFIAPVIALALGAQAAGETPTGWRTDGSGVYAAAQPPTKWSKTENVLWAAPMNSRSNALPIVIGDRVFVCAEPFSLICLDANTGKVVWRKENGYRDLLTDGQWKKIAAAIDVDTVNREQLQDLERRIAEIEKQLEDRDDEKLEQTLEKLEDEADKQRSLVKQNTLALQYRLPKTQRQYNGFTTATPVSDGRHLWTVFGNRAVVCYDLQGNRRWFKVLTDQPHSEWGHSSSPLLINGKLIVNMEQTTAFDAASGAQLWRTKYGHSWGSSIAAKMGSDDVILLANGRWLRASDGKTMVRVPGLANASPVVVGSNAYYVGLQSAAYRLPEKALDKVEPRTLWEAKPRGGTFYASAIVHGGLVYAVSTNHILTVMDAASGKRIYVRRLNLGRQPVWASLCLAGDQLYISSRDGTTIVLKAGRKFAQLARNELEFFIASPVFAGKRMYVRTSGHLYCIGKS